MNENDRPLGLSTQWDTQRGEKMRACGSCWGGGGRPEAALEMGRVRRSGHSAGARVRKRLGKRAPSQVQQGAVTLPKA